MSKWQLLRSSLLDGKRETKCSQSIHRYESSNLFQKTRIPIWKGFDMNIYYQWKWNDASSEHFDLDRLIANLIETSSNYMNYQIDSAQCTIVLHFKVQPNCILNPEDFEIIKAKITNNNSELINFRLLSDTIINESDDFILKLSATSKDYIPTLSVCQYFHYKISSNCGKHKYLYTRESPLDHKVTVKSLLSNKLLGIDNTGNICIWPSETIFLYTLLNNPKYNELVKGRRLLELGGGFILI